MVFKRSNFFLSTKGQTTVEYIMLIAVVISLVAFVARSKIFTDYFGEEGEFSETFRSQFEYTYRHGLNGRKPYQPFDYSRSNHETYARPGGGASRFFGHAEAYP